MAYQAKRKAAYTQDFELVDEKGNVAHRLLVALDPGSCIEKLNQKYITLAKGFSLETAIQRAKEYISGALEAMLDLGKGSGPMNHGFDLQGKFVKEEN